MPDEIIVKIKREANTIAIPQYATPGSAGVDLCSMKYCMIKPGEMSLISTGVYLEIPEGYEGQIRPRSGLVMN
ncbi:MAG: dUTP diphosphatase, partial [Synergistaceae bacterium]|nr:dUTP diphosphatase [Synergistaceae bacterium]